MPGLNAKIEKFWRFLRSLMLRKQIIVLPISPLKIVFCTMDAVLMCLGSMIGHGFHNSLGQLAQRHGIMSFFGFGLGGLIMITIAMCYAELSCLSPTAGNAYHYSYNAIGELFGFLVGWLMILSYGLDLIIASRYLSMYIDHTFFEGKIGIASKHKLTLESLESFIDVINTHPDVISVLIILVVAGRTISLSKESIIATNIMIGINLLTVSIITIIYIFSINYPKTKDHLFPQDLSKLSFMYEGVFFAHYCFTGYDAAVCLGEETENPTINIPKSILFASKATVIIYCSVSFLHCLTWPVDEVDINAPFVYVMTQLKTMPLPWLCAFSSIIGHLSSAHAFMFLLTRLLYSMARDGMIFSVFGRINRNTNSPIFSTFIFTVILGALGMYLRTEYMWTIARASGNISKEVIAVCLLIRRLMHYGFWNIIQSVC
ncbi:unnamed protein product [Nezara viridula]|uniref:Amino acid permease/ SLC12A domain-containing protein n=1 Tax=Nezara viridula TaxID=85310 RepID=A0A9P0H6T3_NEZVI|nr:unnamed protein product [Nezara viridula]